jgi:hypothetical protein
VALGSGQMLLEVDVRRRELERALKLGYGVVEVGLEPETEAQEIVHEGIVRIDLKRLTREEDGLRVVLAGELHDGAVASGHGVSRVDRQRVTKSASVLRPVF